MKWFISKPPFVNFRPVCLLVLLSLWAVLTVSSPFSFLRVYFFWHCIRTGDYQLFCASIPCFCHSYYPVKLPIMCIFCEYRNKLQLCLLQKAIITWKELKVHTQFHFSINPTAVFTLFFYLTNLLSVVSNPKTQLWFMVCIDNMGLFQPLNHTYTIDSDSDCALGI